MNREPRLPTELFLFVVILLALTLGLVLYLIGRKQRAQTGVPHDARVIYADTGAWQRVEKPLFARRYRLAGKPDYLVQDENGVIIPIEVKPNRGASEPRLSDMMQLMAYGLLVEDHFGARPAYGLLKYRKAVFKIEFTEELRAEFFELLQEMRQARRAQNVPRSHADARRCQVCGYRENCGEEIKVKD